MIKLTNLESNSPESSLQFEESTVVDWAPPVAFPETEREFNQRKAVLNRWLQDRRSPPMTTWEDYLARREAGADVP